jgi:hypothetical protein
MGEVFQAVDQSLSPEERLRRASRVPDNLLPEDVGGKFTPAPPNLFDTFGAAALNSNEEGIVGGTLANIGLRLGIGVYGDYSHGKQFVEPTIGVDPKYTAWNPSTQAAFPNITSRDQYLKHQFTPTELKAHLYITDDQLPGWAKKVGFTGLQADMVHGRDRERYLRKILVDDSYASRGWGGKLTTIAGQLIGGQALDTALLAGVGLAAAPIKSSLAFQKVLAAARGSAIGSKFAGTTVAAGAGKLYSALSHQPAGIWGSALHEGLVNAAQEVATLPLQMQNAADSNRTLTVQDAFAQVVMAGAGGAAIHTTVKYGIPAVAKGIGNVTGGITSRFFKNAGVGTVNARASGVGVTPEVMVRDMAKELPTPETVITAMSKEDPYLVDRKTMEDAGSTLPETQERVFHTAPEGRPQVAARELIQAVDAITELHARPEGKAPPAKLYELPNGNPKAGEGVLKDHWVGDDTVRFDSDLDHALFQAGKDTTKIKKSVRDFLEEHFDLDEGELATLAKATRKAILSDLKNGATEVRLKFKDVMEDVLDMPSALIDVLPEVNVAHVHENFVAAADTAIAGGDATHPTIKRLKEAVEASQAGDTNKVAAILKELQDSGDLPSVGGGRKADVDAENGRTKQQLLLDQLEEARKKFRQVETSGKSTKGPVGKKLKDAEDALEAHQATLPERERLAWNFSLKDAGIRESELNALGVDLADALKLTPYQVSNQVVDRLFANLTALKKVAESPVGAQASKSASIKQYLDDIIKHKELTGGQMTTSFISDELKGLRQQADTIKGLPWLQPVNGKENIWHGKIETLLKEVDDLDTQLPELNATFVDALECLIDLGE